MVVKCDFAHPTCSRCRKTKATCSYNGSSTQVDLFNFVHLNNTVDMLQERIQSVEADMNDMLNRPHQITDRDRLASNESITESMSAITVAPRQYTKINGSWIGQRRAPWTLSLSSNGLRIDTDILSLQDVRNLLLSGLSNRNLGCATDQHASQWSETDPESCLETADSTTVARKMPLWKTKLKTFPLYSSWEPFSLNHEDPSPPSCTSCPLLQYLPSEKLEHLMAIYCECFLCLPYVHQKGSMADRYAQGSLDPLLLNSIFAWAARHAAIYHDLFPGKDPNQVGEPFFRKAKQLLKDKFLSAHIDTVHSLIVMYSYAVGVPLSYNPQAESEAYLYLGLANRMVLDLKMHQEPNGADPRENELCRRLFWTLYFLETLCSIHSDKPFSLPLMEFITTEDPSLTDQETGEVQWRTEFMIYRYKITRIYRDIILKTAEENPLLANISKLDQELKEWYQALPPYFQFTPGDLKTRQWRSSSFREQACIKLNSEYNFQLCQLYGLFFSRVQDDTQHQAEQPLSVIELLSKEVCIQAADTIVELLQCWQQLEQRWCHLSLETLMMASMIYQALLCPSSSSNVDWARHQLKLIADILSCSPIKHHKYVFVLVDRIHGLLNAEKCEPLDFSVPISMSYPFSASQNNPSTDESPSTLNLDPSFHFSESQELIPSMFDASYPADDEINCQHSVYSCPAFTDTSMPGAHHNTSSLDVKPLIPLNGSAPYQYQYHPSSMLSPCSPIPYAANPAIEIASSLPMPPFWMRSSPDMLYNSTGFPRLENFYPPVHAIQVPKSTFSFSQTPN
ncbi:uncharacterized protein BYT42DRAFT_588546 [Radiomyces spectabilis]|uniref:uncharacterized protein n=1 Tax=Radiomyces spectabilis TaxID=64574 RepID=UPI002220D5C9|nr:uncharacterized protein BYT42DRAFT_588546 [Radiomyces spectabilis]KAI8366011.1 hypothetical protein BYT42DRAFT_588546 [Radiomyces spectabilis]